MTLNRLLDILTPESALGLSTRTILSDVNTREISHLLWGVVYAREFVSSVPPFNITELVKVELAYEGTVTGRLYLTRPSYEQVNTKSLTDTEFYDVVDEKLQLFGSKEEYKRFFLALAQLRKEGRIDDNEYIRVFQKLTRLAISVPQRSILSAIQKALGVGYRQKAIDEALQIAQSDPLIRKILSEAGMNML